MNKVSGILIISLITNSILSFFKILVGLIGSSSALIADGIHSFSDLITDVIGLFGSYFSKKPSDEKHPYGHGKIEYLISIFIGIVIIILGFFVIYNSINRSIIVPSMLVIVVTIFAIAIKFLLAQYLIKKGKEFNNSILISSGKESSADVISSVVVLISSLLMQLDISFFKYSDIIAGILVGILVLKVGFDVLKENISTIIGEQVTNNEYLNLIKQIFLNHEKIKDIDDLIILKYGPYHKLISKIIIDESLSVLEANKIVEKIELEIKDKFNNIDYIYISFKSSSE